MEWLDRFEIQPKTDQRIIVWSTKTRKVHVLHWGYEDWILSETDDDFAGEGVDFRFWMPVPNQPERSKREEAIVFDLDGNTKGVIHTPDHEIKIRSSCGALNTQETE